MSITIKHQKLDIADVRGITVTDIVEADGSYSRAIRVLADPVVNNVATEIIEIVVTSDDREDIEIQAPTQKF